MRTQRNAQSELRFVTCGERTQLRLQRFMDLDGCGREIERHDAEDAYFVAVNALVQTGVYLCPDCCDRHGIVYGRQSTPR